MFGVHGDWGLGKTSFLHQLQWHLTCECPQQPESVTNEMETMLEEGHSRYKDTIQAVWFDAWRYQNETAPVVALLHEMRAQLSWKHRMIGSTARIAQVTTRAALLSIEEVTKKIGYQHSKFREANREWEIENLAAALPSHMLREHLSAAVGQLLPKPKNKPNEPTSRLVVFIDDIDRCEPESAYRLLEGLKVYLTLDNCVFVLGMNQKVIIEAINQRVKTANDNIPSQRAAAYMEKMCQNVWQLPAVRQPEQVLLKLLEETVIDESVRLSIEMGLQGLDCSCIPPNPRRIKGLANLIGRMSLRLPSTNSKDEMLFEVRLLVIVAYIYQFHQDLYVRWESELSLYKKIRDWCDNQLQQDELFKHLILPLKGSRAGPGGIDIGNDSRKYLPRPRPTQTFSGSSH